MLPQARGHCTPGTASPGALHRAEFATAAHADDRCQAGNGRHAVRLDRASGYLPPSARPCAPAPAARPGARAERSRARGDCRPMPRAVDPLRCVWLSRMRAVRAAAPEPPGTGAHSRTIREAGPCPAPAASNPRPRLIRCCPHWLATAGSIALKITSTRRFICRPAALSLLALGNSSPRARLCI